MKKIVVTTSLIAALSATTLASNAAHAGEDNSEQQKNVLVGMGSGASLGAIIGGPVGGVVGGLLGIMLGEDVNQHNEENELLAQLDDKSTQLAQLQQQYAQLQSDYQSQLLATAAEVATPAPNDYQLMPLEASLQFKTGSSQLEQHYLGNLDLVAEKLKANPDLQLQLFGYADRRGDAQFNLELSEQRAEQVKIYLLSQGVAASQIETGGYGEAQPVAVQQNFENDFFDRRVVLRLNQDSKVMTAKQP